MAWKVYDDRLTEFKIAAVEGASKEFCDVARMELSAVLKTSSAARMHSGSRLYEMRSVNL